MRTKIFKKNKKRVEVDLKNDDIQLKRKVQEKRRKVEEEVPEETTSGIDDDDGNDAGVRSFETVRNKETSSKDGIVWRT